MSFYQFEKWTWQQMLVFLLEIKRLNNSQKCPFSPLDNKVYTSPSTLWHWSRCPSLSNGVRGLPWPLAKLANKALGFSNLPRVLATLNIKSLPFNSDAPFCSNEQNVTLSEAEVDICSKQTCCCFRSSICAFDVNIINQWQPVYHQQWRFPSSQDTSWPDF